MELDSKVEVEYWKNVAAFNSLVSNFNASISAKQKALSEQIEEAAKKANELLGTLAPEGFEVDLQVLQSENRISLKEKVSPE